MRVGTKAQIRARKKGKGRISKAAFPVFATVMILTVFTYAFLSQSQNQTTNTDYSKSKAAIVDQLSLTFPNQTFIEAATTILEQAGYTVDYYPGEEVTVEFYRNLPTHGYSLIILRAHSTTGGFPSLSLFTSERYDKFKYLQEQLTDKICAVAYSIEEMKTGKLYFGITPSFVKASMNGKFANTVIIMMGCEGLNNTQMARAFTEKGAKVYISWTQSVSAFHTDRAITHLLQHFLIEKLTLQESLRETFKEVGFDPVCQTLLIYYPRDVGEQTIEDIKGNQN